MDITASNQEAKVVVTSWKALFNFTTRSHAIALIPALFLSVVSGILAPAMAIFFGKFFDAFSSFGAHKIDGHELMHRISTDACALVGLGGAAWILKGGYFATWLIFGELQAKSVRDQLFQNLLEKDLEWYEMRSNGVGSLLSRLQTHIRELQIGTSQPLGFAIKYTVQAFTSLGLSFYYSWKLTLVILAGVPFSALILSFISSMMQPSIVAQELEADKASKRANNAISAIDTVKCFNGQDYEIRQYSSATKTAAFFYLRQALSNALQIGFVRFITTSMFVQGFWYGSHLVSSSDTSAGKVLTTFYACLGATKAFEDILPHIIVLERGRAAGIALKGILDHVDKGRKVSKTVGGVAPKFCEGDIEFRGISFAYPSRPDHEVLTESTFFFPAGETTFVVGKSGSGKSTLGNLLVRFYRPSSGLVLIDGISIEALDNNWIRNNITLVQQQSMLFSETIFSNIAFGHRDHTRATKQHVKAGVELAMLQETVREMPKGLDTMVGKGGASLSGGQTQRVAIARARLRDTPVLVLDESTSALDYISKAAVMNAIRSWRKGRTTIIITHDMLQIKDRDFVYVLEQGHIAEEGYRHKLAAVDDGMFSTSSARPKKGPAIHFSSGWIPRSTTKATESDFLNRPARARPLLFDRQDSMELQLDAIRECPPRYSLAEGVVAGHNRESVGKRSSKGPSVIYEAIKRQASIRATPLLGQYPATSRDLDLLQRREARTRISRPMSMHQAITMQSIYREQPSRKSSTIATSLERSRSIDSRQGKPFSIASVRPQVISVKKILKTVWPALDSEKRRFLVLGFVAAIVHAASTPAFSYIFAQLLGTFFMAEDRAQKALVYSMATLGITTIDSIAALLLHYLLEAAAQNWIDKLRVEAFTRILDQPKAWFDHEENNVSQLVSSLDRNAEEMRNLLGRFAAFILVVAAMMVIAVTWSLITCWKVTLVAIASCPALVLLTKAFEAVATRLESRTNTFSEKASAIFSETFSDIRTVRTLTLESHFHKKYSRATSKAFTVGVKRAIYTGFFFGASDSAINYVTAFIFWYGAIVVRSQDFPVKSVLTVFSMLLFSTASANAVISYIPQISSSVDTASRLLRLSSLPLQASHEHVGILKLDPHDADTLNGSVNFTNVTFTYPSRPGARVLQDFNLVIPNGSCTAIVGASGSGKSTIATLLLGFYPPLADPLAPSLAEAHSARVGRLTLSNHDIRSLHLPTLRSMVCIVPQSPTLFPASIRENITYGLDFNSALTTTANVELAALQAGIHDFIVSLPGGYDTVIGDGGLGVSGGQAQRIVIARALVRRPRILILDEATSALDGESAELVKQSVLGLVQQSSARAGIGARRRPGLTVIIITHSREMMDFAENVVVLDKGQVVEQGAFAHLVAKRGKLFEMLRMGGALE